MGASESNCKQIKVYSHSSLHQENVFKTIITYGVRK